MKYKITKGVNVMLGCLSLILGVIICIRSNGVQENQTIDVIFLVLCGICTLEAITAVLLSFSLSYRNDISPIVDWTIRVSTCALLCSVGGTYIYYGALVEVCEGSRRLLICHYKTRIVAGVVCFFNGILHVLAKNNMPIKPTPGVYMYPTPTTVANARTFGIPTNNITMHPIIPPSPAIIPHQTTFMTPAGYQQQSSQILGIGQHYQVPYNSHVNNINQNTHSLPWKYSVNPSN